MLRIDRICVWTFIAMLAMALPAVSFVSFLDEVLIYSLLGWVALDCIVNRDIKKYTPLFIFFAIVALYAVYSITVVHFTIPKGVLLGTIIETKAYLVMLVIYCVAPEMTQRDKNICRIIAIVTSIVVILSLSVYYYALYYLYNNPATIGGVCYMCAMIYFFCSIDEEGEVPAKRKMIVCAMLILGLVCTRSKYYGEFVITLAMIFTYRQGMTRHIKPLQMAEALLLLVIIVVVIWDKFTFYFIDGLSNMTIDLNAMESYARLALYFGMFMIMMDFPLLGTGFGTFASFPSGKYYSSVYARYGIDKVYGLSESYPNFINDAYYPSLAQFGLVGIGLFIYFWCWIYRNLRIMTREISERYRNEFVAGVCILFFVFIEMTTGSLVFQPSGETLVMLLAFVCADGKRLRARQKETATATVKEETTTATSPEIRKRNRIA